MPPPPVASPPRDSHRRPFSKDMDSGRSSKHRRRSRSTSRDLHNRYAISAQSKNYAPNESRARKPPASPLIEDVSCEPDGVQKRGSLEQEPLIIDVSSESSVSSPDREAKLEPRHANVKADGPSKPASSISRQPPPTRSSDEDSSEEERQPRRPQRLAVSTNGTTANNAGAPPNLERARSPYQYRPPSHQKAALLEDRFIDDKPLLKSPLSESSTSRQRSEPRENLHSQCPESNASIELSHKSPARVSTDSFLEERASRFVDKRATTMPVHSSRQKVPSPRRDYATSESSSSDEDDHRGHSFSSHGRHTRTHQARTPLVHPISNLRPEISEATLNHSPNRSPLSPRHRIALDKGSRPRGTTEHTARVHTPRSSPRPSPRPSPEVSPQITPPGTPSTSQHHRRSHSLRKPMHVQDSVASDFHLKSPRLSQPLPSASRSQPSPSISSDKDLPTSTSRVLTDPHRKSSKDHNTPDNRDAHAGASTRPPSSMYVPEARRTQRDVENAPSPRFRAELKIDPTEASRSDRHSLYVPSNLTPRPRASSFIEQPRHRESMSRPSRPSYTPSTADSGAAVASGATLGLGLLKISDDADSRSRLSVKDSSKHQHRHRSRSRTVSDARPYQRSCSSAPAVRIPASQSESPILLPQCPLLGKEGLGNQEIYYSLARQPSMVICGDCRRSVFGRGYERSWVRRYTSDNESRKINAKLRCAMHDPWVRLACLIYFNRGQSADKLLGQLADVADDLEPCPQSKPVTNQQWFHLRDTETRRSYKDFQVCAHCVDCLETIYPPLNNLFRSSSTSPPSSSRETDLSEARVCNLRSDMQRFAKYLDCLGDMAQTSYKGSSRTISTSDFIWKVKLLTVITPCKRDAVHYGEDMHTHPLIPNFTVCEECYFRTVRPLLSTSRRPRTRSQSRSKSRSRSRSRSTSPRRGRNGSTEERDHDPNETIARDITPEAKEIVGGVTCILYSPRMKQIFDNACHDADLEYLIKAVTKRHELQQDLIRAQAAAAKGPGGESKTKNGDVDWLLEKWRQLERRLD